MVKLRYVIQNKEDVTNECPLCGNPKLIKFSNCEDCKKKWGVQLEFKELERAISSTDYFRTLHPKKTFF